MTGTFELLESTCGSQRLSRRRRSLLAGVLVLALLLSACAAPTQPAQPPEAEPPLGNSQFAIRNLQEAAHYYNRYHELSPDDLLGPSAKLRTSLK